MRVLEGFGDLNQSARDSLERLLSDPEDLDRRCRAALLDPGLTCGDGSGGEGAELYVRHHLSELNGLAARLGIDSPKNPGAAAIERFLGVMSVRSIWTAGDDDGGFLHVDYTIDAGRTDYVLCVVLDREGVIQRVEMES
ncbi:MAG TPA: DUF2004 domain-containing protein [Myxococcaceae bacterium]